MKLRPLLFSSLLSLLGLLFPAEIRAQHLGDVSLSTVNQILFPTGTACTGSPQTAVITNNGQTNHSVYMTVGGASMTSVQYFLEGSNDGATFTRLSDETDGSVNGNLQASGNFTVARVNITCLPAGTATFGITYTGSGVPAASPQGDGLRAQIEKTLVVNTNAGADQNGQFRTPYGNLAGLLKVAVGTAAGSPTISLTCQFNVLALNTTQTFSLVTGANNISVPASPCAVVTWTYTHGTSSGTFSAEYVFSVGFSGASGTGATGSAGCVPAGTVITCNPLAIGGKTAPTDASPNQAQFVTVFPQQLPTATLNIFGMVIGAGNLSDVAGSAGVTFPNSGPMASAAYAHPAAVAAPGPGVLFESAGQGTPGVTATATPGNSLPGLLVTNGGYTALTTTQTVTTNSTLLVTTTPWNFGTFDGCYVTLVSNAGTGTAPTLDVHFQIATDGVNFEDRIHFAQITTSASQQRAAIVTGTAGLTPATISATGLAASAIENGPIGGWFRFQYVVTGTTPSFTGVQEGIVCH